MTEEKRQPREQIAYHTYKRPAGADQSARSVHVSDNSRQVTGPQRRVKQLDHVQPTAGEEFVHRRNQLYSARASSSTYNTRMTPLTPRTLAQTGVPATNGRMHAIHPARKALSQQHSSPIPVRSGRTQGRRSGFLWKILGLFALLAIVVLGASYALTSTAFRIAQVDVIGTHNDALVSNIQHMGMQGQNIFLIDVTTLNTRIDALPMVASASLEKQWPNQLQITVVERQPVLLWKTGQNMYSVDKTGVVIAAASQTAAANTLPVVVDMRGSTKSNASVIRPGTQLNQADIAFAGAVFTGLAKVGVSNYALRYVSTGGQGTLGTNGSYVVASTSGWLAYLGGSNDANPLSNRLIELQQILTFAQQQQINLATIDVRYGLRPVYTAKS